MPKRLTLFFTLLCIIVSLSGCQFSIRNTVEGQDATLPPLRIDSSLVCSVQSIDGTRLHVVILEGNSNFNKDDEIYVTYETVEKDQTVQRNDVITFQYNYVTDVSAYAKLPHILAGQISIIPDYEPPATEATEADATEATNE